MKRAKMESQTSEEAELERVLTRLASINDETRLEQVLFTLLPRLVEKLQVLPSEEAKAKQVLIEIFSHVTRWVKPPSKIKLPLVALAETIRTKCSKASQALRVGVMLIDLGFDRCTDEERTQCVGHLLACTDKLDDSQCFLVKFLFPLVDKMDRATLEAHRLYLADLALDCCFPLNFFPVTSGRTSRLNLPNKPAKTMEEHAQRSYICLSLLVRLAQWDASLAPTMMAAGILCSSVGMRDDVKSMGEEALRRVKTSNTGGDREDEFKTLMDLFLGTTERPKSPVQARIKVLEMFGKLDGIINDKTRDRFVKVLVSGLFGTDQPVQVKVQTLKLIGTASSAFTSDSQAERFLSNALKQLVSQSVDHLTSDHRAALFMAFAKWTASHDLMKSLVSTVEVCVKLITTMSTEHDPEAIEAEFSCLSVVGDSLKDDSISLVLSHPLVHQAIEVGRTTGSGDARIKGFALSLARRAEVVSMSVMWVLMLAARPGEPRATKEAASKRLDQLTRSSSSLYLPSLDVMLSFIERREAEWTKEQIEPPKGYFFPSAMRIIRSHHVISTANPRAIESITSSRLMDGMLGIEDDEVKFYCVDFLVQLLTMNKSDWVSVDHIMQGSLFTWTEKQLLTSNHDSLRRACAHLLQFIPSNQELKENIIHRLKRFNLTSFAEVHGVLLAAGTIQADEAVAKALVEWTMDERNKLNNENRELRNEAFLSLSKCSTILTEDDMKRLIKRAKEALANKNQDDALQGVIEFLGTSASMSERPSESGEAFQVLLSLTSDSRFNLSSQQAIGRSLSSLPNEKLIDVTRQILQKNIVEEGSQKARQSAAVLLEQLVRGGGALMKEIGLVLDLIDGFCGLLGEPEEMVRQCACRGIFELYFHADALLRDKLTRQLIRHLDIGVLDRASNAPETTTPPTTTTTTDLEGNAPRRARLGGARRGGDDRVWPYRDLMTACSQSGLSSMVFPLFGLISNVLAEEEEKDQVSPRAKSILQAQLSDSSSNLSRLAVQFTRRRHLDDPSRQAATLVWDIRLKDEKVFETATLCTPIWTECARLLRDSFLAKERRSACLSMSEIASKYPDDLAFPCTMEEAWRCVFRALDDLDESIASGPALALGRGVKRRTLILLRGDGGDSAEIDSLLAYLLDSGLGHPAKPARDLTRAFFVDAISQDKLPLRGFVCPIVESLIRTIGESEHMMLQYAQFHTRGGQGTGEIGLDAKQLEELRARLALESPEYRAALKLAGQLKRPDQAKIARDLVLTVAKSIRTGVGLATLVSAVQLGGFLASDEWAMSPLVIQQGDGGQVLLNSLSLKFSSDTHSHELRRRIGSSAAVVCRALERTPTEAATQQVLSYCRMIASAYENDSEASIETRLLAASACFDLVKRQVHNVDTSLVRAAFLGRFDEDKQVADEWKLSLENGLQGQVTLNDSLDFCSHGINSQTYRARSQASKCLLMVFTSKELERASQAQLGMDLVKMTCSNADWEGKDLLIRATGKVFSASAEPDTVQYSLFALLETMIQAGSKKRPKWLLEAMFDAMGMMLDNPCLLPETRNKFLSTILKESDLSEEPLVIASFLKCLVKAIQAQLDGEVTRGVFTLVNRLLGATPTWNVRLGALDLASKTIEFYGGDDVVWGDFPTVLRLTLNEEKKPMVLVGSLRCVMSLIKSVNQTVLREARLLAVHVKPDLERLEKSSDVGLGKMAHDILQVVNTL